MSPGRSFSDVVKEHSIGGKCGHSGVGQRPLPSVLSSGKKSADISGVNDLCVQSVKSCKKNNVGDVWAGGKARVPINRSLKCQSDTGKGCSRSLDCTRLCPLNGNRFSPLVNLEGGECVRAGGLGIDTVPGPPSVVVKRSEKWSSSAGRKPSHVSGNPESGGCRESPTAPSG